MSVMCGLVVQYSLLLCNVHSLNSRQVSQQMKAKTYEVCNRLSLPKKAVGIRQCSTE